MNEISPITSVRNLLVVKENIETASKKYLIDDTDNSGTETKLVAVSKTRKSEEILPVLEAGQRIFGENKVQEAAEKWLDLKHKYSDIELHLIGPLQTNKVKQAVEIFDIIETVDREKLAVTLRKEFDRSGKELPVFIQVNTGEEEQKSGIKPSGCDEFISFCISELNLPVKGLMCIPPVGEPPAPHFALLKKIAKRNGLEIVSMGMSGDYELAAAMGANYVRVGSAIFGER